jgi:hypothetical protein
MGRHIMFEFEGGGPSGKGRLAKAEAREARTPDGARLWVEDEDESPHVGWSGQSRRIGAIMNRE